MPGVDRPETRYAPAGDLSIAYQVFGEGPIDIALDVWWFNNVDTQWDVAPLARLLERFASFSRGAQRGRPRPDRAGAGPGHRDEGRRVVATFDGPARAIRCARDICRDVKRLGIDVRTGLHTGEIELIGDDIGGIAVHIAARIMSLAAPGEVLVSSTVKDLVVGSDLTFEDRGTTALKGVPGEWRLLAAVDA
jgi:class 3 adenylate cyclase